MAMVVMVIFISRTSCKTCGNTAISLKFYALYHIFGKAIQWARLESLRANFGLPNLMFDTSALEGVT